MQKRLPHISELFFSAAVWCLVAVFIKGEECFRFASVFKRTRERKTRGGSNRVKSSLSLSLLRLPLLLSSSGVPSPHTILHSFCLLLPPALVGWYSRKRVAAKSMQAQPPIWPLSLLVPNGASSSSTKCTRPDAGLNC